jgi:hypothetical protein
MPRSVQRKPLWQEIQEVARRLGNFNPASVLHECLRVQIITPRMIAKWGNATGELRCKAALKREIAPGVPFSGVISCDREQMSFTWAPVDSMRLEEYRAMLRHDMDNCGRAIKTIKQKQTWGRNKWGDVVDLEAFEEFSPAWMQRYIDLANGHDPGDPSDPGEDDD